ncbi:MAG: type II RES/Xre toxin-antitoxin system antitoxin [Pyrinomonadaceae bacterium]
MRASSQNRNKGPVTPDIAVFVKNFNKGLRSSQHMHVVLLGLSDFNAQSLLKKVEQGFSFRVFEHLQRNMALPKYELADLIMIRPRTLNRRKDEGRLQPDESDRLLRASRIFGRALELFNGRAEAARRWLASAQPALNGETPLNVAKTDIGAREVENLIGRIEQGVFT